MNLQFVFPQIEYLVKWKNFDISENSWVKEPNMNCQELIRNFERGAVYGNDQSKYIQ